MSVYCHSFENGFSNFVIPTPTTKTLFATAGPPYSGLAQIVEESGRERNTRSGKHSTIVVAGAGRLELPFSV
jgi:hypothetical protein